MEAITKPRSGHDETLRRVDEDGVEFIRLWFTDIQGQLKSFAIGREELEGALAEGMGFDGSSITGFNRIEESDMIAMPDPDTYTVLPWRTDGHKGNVAQDVLRHPDARPRAVRGGSALRDAPRARPRRGAGVRHLQHRPRARVLLLRERRAQRGRGADDPGQGRVLRPDDPGRRLRPAPRHGQRAEGGRDPGRVHAPRGGALPARDRHALRRGAADVRQRDDLPDRGQGDRQPARRLRDLHAQAAVRRERLGHAHAPVAVLGGLERVLRSRRRLSPVGRGEVVHRRPAAARA